MAGREIINTLTIIIIIITLSFAILRYYTKHFMQNNPLKPPKNSVE